MQTTHYTIGELAKAAEVTPRTVRFYTAEGLLPPPLTEGRYALYTEGHLLRLRLIQRLKNAFLPLAAIRTQMADLTEAQILQLLDPGASADPAGEEQKRLSLRIQATDPHAQQSSAEYLAQILAVTGQGKAAAEQGEGERPRKALLVSPVYRRQEPGGSPVRESGAAIEAPEAGEVWERIRLREGIELHVRTPQSAEERAQIARLVAQARALFTETP